MSIIGHCSRLLRTECFRLARCRFSTDTKHDLASSMKFMHLIETKGRPEHLLRLKRLRIELSDLQELGLSGEKDMQDLVKSELKQAEKNLEALQRTILTDLVSYEDVGINSLLLEINCGVGGQEAMLFANELLEVYLKYIASKGWTIRDVNTNASDIGGILSASCRIEGKFCYQHLRHEAGVHRVQRTPKTEKAGRVHTSTVTVNVLPIEGDEEDIVILPDDLEWATKRSSGAGGQHVNKTESCAIVKHKPTGIVMECQEGRSLISNKEKALVKLKNELFIRKQRKLYEDMMNKRKSQVSSADRSEKVRTYNFVQDRITDHRLSENMHGIKEFMKGNVEKLDSLVTLLEVHHTENAISNLIKSFKD